MGGVPGPHFSRKANGMGEREEEDEEEDLARKSWSWCYYLRQRTPPSPFRSGHNLVYSLACTAGRYPLPVKESLVLFSLSLPCSFPLQRVLHSCALHIRARGREATHSHPAPPPRQQHTTHIHLY